MEIGDFASAKCVHEEIGDIKGLVVQKYEGEGTIGIMAAPNLARIYICLDQGATAVPDEQFDERARQWAGRLRTKRQRRQVSNSETATT